VVREILDEKYLREATSLDISLPQFNLLRLIDHNGNHYVGEMANFLGVSQAAASKNVDKLVRLKLVAREIQADDRRATSLSLTARGKKIIRRYEALKQEKLREVMASFDPEELGGVIQGLEKVCYMILKKEEDIEGVCMKCRAYYIEHCPLQSLSTSCIYVRNRKQTGR
jgi:DNA-binding MarR family transcriptional regulator